MTISSSTHLALDFSWNGFLVLPGAISDEIVAEARRETDELFEDEDHRRVGKVQDAWEIMHGTRAVAIAPEVLDTLRSLYGRHPIPYQTLNYLHGSERRAHCDSMHASTMPAGYVCSAWTALDETDAANGPLFYYPGSHHLPELTPRDVAGSLADFDYGDYEAQLETLMQTHGYERRVLHARPGDVIVFAGNLAHGGCPILDPGRTRRSVVTQYVFERCVYYTPLLSDVPANEIVLRNNVVDIASGRRAKHSHDGRPVARYSLDNRRSHVQLDANLAQRARAFVREARQRFPQAKVRARQAERRRQRQATGETVRLD